MLFSGYLTIKEKIDDRTYLVRIPNKETQTFFKGMFVDIVFKGNNNIGDMKQALYSKDIGRIIRILEEVVLNAMSFYDTDKKYENPYQTLISGFLYGLDTFYEMIPNIESGYGRADIILEPRYKNYTGYIFEFNYNFGHINVDNELTGECEDCIEVGIGIIFPDQQSFESKCNEWLRKRR